MRVFVGVRTLKALLLISECEVGERFCLSNTFLHQIWLAQCHIEELDLSTSCVCVLVHCMCGCGCCRLTQVFGGNRDSSSSLLPFAFCAPMHFTLLCFTSFRFNLYYFICLFTFCVRSYDLTKKKLVLFVFQNETKVTRKKNTYIIKIQNLDHI